MKKFMKLFSGKSSKTKTTVSADDHYFDKPTRNGKKLGMGMYGNHSTPDFRNTYKSKYQDPPPMPAFPPRQQSRRLSVAAKLPNEILAKIFTFVAPHVANESLYSDEEILHYVNGCVLCDTRDLAHMALVCLKWSRVAQMLLYKNIQLERTHYCGREEQLDEIRKRRSKVIYTDPDTIDTAAERMDLLIRTFRLNDELANYTFFIRLQYMTRESCKNALTSLVNVPLTNLRWMDLPDGFYKDDVSCQALKAIMYQKCPDLRRMRWTDGSENGFLGLTIDRPWVNLEFIELWKLNVEEEQIAAVLASLPKVTSVGIQELPWVTGRFLSPPAKGRRPLLPPLNSLSISKCENITYQSIIDYISIPAVQQHLEHLTLKEIDFPPHLIYKLLQSLPKLKTLRIIAPVTRIFPAYDQPPHPPLESVSLRELSYEIRPAQQSKTLASPATSYYEYLCESLRLGGLPNLKTLHVRDETFGKMLKRVTETMQTYGKDFAILQTLEKLTIHAKAWNGLVWSTFTLNEQGCGEELDEFGALLMAAGGGNISPGPQSPRFLGLPNAADEKRLSWRERRENRKSRMDLWR
ncbi:hypothetical protein H072_6421 [Dactylellina haptotyla CBS 200.50]|uniref:Uncharacterized protein n=1 Tax=Dactylellina haptotyla (strain CBS 200.50) TaxID=1284197 RepID=S8AFN4_DACHA|nr:hypothetical protein H072_6421 [Dactylellina haptotyla CBS 200.50]